MKNSKKANVAIIGGTGFEKLLRDFRTFRLATPYGISPPLFIGETRGKDTIFLPRHGMTHSAPPHKIDYRTNIYALHKAGVKRIIATNAVGAINPSFSPGNLVIPHDFVDFTKLRSTTFYDEAPVTHVDISEPYCPEIRRLFSEKAKTLGLKIWDEAVLVCTEGPRYETPAEIAMFRHLGFDVVGMTGVPEVVLARELGICYASVCCVSNMAAGMQERLTVSEVTKVLETISSELEQALILCIENLPMERNCRCREALRDARLEK